jgi:hypothetical protein
MPEHKAAYPIAAHYMYKNIPTTGYILLSGTNRTARKGPERGPAERGQNYLQAKGSIHYLIKQILPRLPRDKKLKSYI